MGISEIFSTSSQKILQLHVSRKKILEFAQKFGTCNKNGNFGAFLVKA